MAWRVIARQEARETFGARSIRFLLGVLLLVCLTAGYVYPIFGQEPYTTARFGGYVSPSLATVVPLLGLVIGYNAIVSERASGALYLTLSLPNARADVVFGKLLGRGGLIAAGIVVGLAGAGGLVVYPFGDLAVLPFIGLVLLTVALGAVYTGIGIAISMVAGSKPLATIAAFGVYFLFVLIWSDVEAGIELGLSAIGVIGDELPDPVTFLFAMEPGVTYERLIAGFIDPAGATPGPWYLGEWAALVLLVCWLVVPLGLAQFRFEGVDL